MTTPAVDSPFWTSGSDQELVDALAKANADRGLLASLRASGRVRRSDDAYARRNQGFIKEIESTAFPHRVRGQDTIRPKKRKR